MKNAITIDSDDTLQFDITDKDGKPTGEYLEFNMNDISLPLRYRDLILADKQNRENLKKDTFILNKKEDIRTEGDPLSKNEIEALKLSEQYLNKEVEIYNKFLGENGVQKLLCGKPLAWDTLNKIDILIKEKIIPVLNEHTKSMEELIKNKYSNDSEEELL